MPRPPGKVSIPRPQRYCTYCRQPESDDLPLSGAAICTPCRNERVYAAAMQLHERRGPVYDEWLLSVSEHYAGRLAEAQARWAAEGPPDMPATPDGGGPGAVKAGR